mmetsp:Transcript_49851/g.108304  ORF Transcript_49851/g.108304 Transcript_49851/m.108304 type:complete len:261 (+) Transcript_49851:1-783(+)
MGQGVHIKIAVVVANALNVPLSSIRVTETDSSIVPHGAESGGSTTADLAGGAIVDACRQLSQRLAPFRESLGPSASMEQLVAAVYEQQLPLSAVGHYTYPIAKDDVGWHYFTFGAAAVEAEVDLGSGVVRFPSAQVALDVGNTASPAIDIGQVEGALVKGLGWTCIEELRWDQDARMTNDYVVPNSVLVPSEFGVHLLRSDGPGLATSRGVGEPPFCTGVAGALAVRRAIAAATSRPLPDALRLPLTPQRVRQLVGSLCE